MRNKIAHFTLAVLLMAVAHTLMAQEHNHNHHGHQHGDEKHGESANEFMHKSSTADLVQRFESPERDAYQQPEKVLKYLGRIKGKTIMDIGAGSGYFSVKLADKGANVIAADVNDEFQAFLKNRIEKDQLQRITLRKIPYDSPALRDGEVDMVLIVNTYHHIGQRADYFAKVKKGIKTGGELVVVDFFKSDVPVGPPTDHKVSIDEVIAELKQAGFTQFEVEVNLLPYQFIVKAR